MATLSFVRPSEGASNPSEIIERYITNYSKAKSGRICLGRGVNNDIVDCMKLVSNLYGEKDNVKLVHFILTFAPEEVNNVDIATGIGAQVMAFIGTKYQVCCAIHEDTEDLHIHFVFHTLCYLDGDSYDANSDEQYMTNFIARILRYRVNLPLNCK